MTEREPRLGWQTLPLADERVASNLAERSKFGTVMIDRASRFHGSRSHLKLHRDGKGYFVRIGWKGLTKRYLGYCKITYIDGEPSLFAYAFAD